MPKMKTRAAPPSGSKSALAVESSVPRRSKRHILTKKTTKSKRQLVRHDGCSSGRPEAHSCNASLRLIQE